MIFKWNSELREASTLKLSKETGWSQISIESLTAVDIFDFDRLMVIGEIPILARQRTFENVLWRAREIPSIPSLKNAVILYGTNNINKDSPYGIA